MCVDGLKDNPSVIHWMAIRGAYTYLGMRSYNPYRAEDPCCMLKHAVQTQLVRLQTLSMSLAVVDTRAKLYEKYRESHDRRNVYRTGVIL